jgi:hypothetical protein
VARVLHSRRRLLPRGWPDALRQLALFAGAYVLYRVVRGLADGQTTAAFENARNLVSLERAMGLFFEPAVQAWAVGSSWILTVADLAYLHSHFVITTAFLVWLYLARNTAFYFVRNMFVVSMAIALAGYALFPTAPPRFLPEWGFTDTVVSRVGEAAANGFALLYNPFAAVPSMHVGFALMIGVVGVKLVGSGLAKVLWAAYPLVVTFVVVVTANHFWIDAVFGAMVALASAYIAHAAALARPDAWAWRARAIEAPA